jgi:hypothetical protein
MNELRTAEFAHPGNAQPLAAKREPYAAMAKAPDRYPRLGRLAAVALLAASAVWAIGREAARRIQTNDIETSPRRQPPLPEFPKASLFVDNNNQNARLGFVPNPDGTAVAYAEEASRLVSEGRWRTDLSLYQLASALNVSPDSIANPQCPGEINPDAELFRARAGRLTESAKALSRDIRRRRLLAGNTPDDIVVEWVITNYSFTLNRLKHPSNAESAVLSAIASSATGILPRPGDAIRAVGVNRGELVDNNVALKPGFLPLEAPQQGSHDSFAQP